MNLQLKQINTSRHFLPTKALEENELHSNSVNHAQSISPLTANQQSFQLTRMDALLEPTNPIPPGRRGT